MPKKHINDFKSDDKKEALNKLLHKTIKLLPQFGDYWMRHNLLTQNVTSTSRILYLNHLYKMIVDVPGVVCEFGVQWGSTLSQLINLRSIYEPFNHSRVIYGFDTFEGFPSIHEKDGEGYGVGDLATLDNYELELDEILTLIEKFPPVSHIKKYELIKGNVISSIDKWLEDNPHAIISLAIFDMDLYEPTKEVLQKIKPRLTKGSVLAFDELNCKVFPGETIALNEVFGLNNITLKRSPLHPYCSWAVYGE